MLLRRAARGLRASEAVGAPEVTERTRTADGNGLRVVIGARDRPAE
jgi:hypothetical protein